MRTFVASVALYRTMLGLLARADERGGLSHGIARRPYNSSLAWWGCGLSFVRKGRDTRSRDGSILDHSWRTENRSRGDLSPYFRLIDRIGTPNGNDDRKP